MYGSRGSGKRLAAARLITANPDTLLRLIQAAPEKEVFNSSNPGS